MQSGGQAAGIQLQVGLDLAFFRNQLPKLGAAAAGYTLPINIKFDRRAVQNELNALGRNISQRTYRLEVATNLAAEIELAKKLTTALDNLGRSQQTAKTGVGQRLGVGAIGRAPSQGGLGSKDVEKLYRASARAGLLIFDKEIAKTKVSMVAAMDAIGVDVIAGLLNGLSSQDARLRAAAESIGENLIKTTKTSLGIASPSKKFEEIGKNVGKGFEKGALSSMDNAFDAMENKMRQRGKILDTIARGIFGMLGMDPAAMMQQARQQKAVPLRTPIAGLLPSYTSRGAREETMRQLGAGGGGGGGPSDQGPGKLALSNEALGKRVNAILEEYFRVAEVQVRESFDPSELKRSLNIFSYIAQSLRDAESRTKQARVAESVDSLMRAIDNAIKAARAQVKDLGRTAQPMLPSARIAGLLPAGGKTPGEAITEAYIAELRRSFSSSRNAIAGLLPAGVGRAPSVYSTGGIGGESREQIIARRTREAYMRSAQRETQVLSERGGALPGTTFMGDDFVRGGGRDRVTGSGQPRERGGSLAFLGGGMGPSSQLGAGYFEVGKGLQAIKQAYAGVKPFLDTKKLPLSGAMAELGGEFGTAIKQVLLYGTAYKALAFFTSLPGQAFEAAKGLATYRNQLQAVTSESKTFDQSLAFVDNLAQRFNVPLDSARQGFVKLYASMQPAGFGQEQIEGLFTGISKAAAAFGLSADKVDRVNYAFAQMASKGQIMSEELKGQLGDVLPGALGLFAQAAQMSIPEFSKAMEDGAFKGKAMEQVLDNVAILMNNKFGPAAQGAAKTLQGAVNQIQNNLTLMYESFGPIVDRFAAIFGPQINSLIKDVTETMKVLTGTFTATGEGFATLSPRAQAFYAAIQSLTPPLQQAGAAIADLGSRFATLLPAMVQAIAAAISFASSPLGRGAIIASVAIGTLTAAIKLLEVTGLKAAIKSVYLFIGSLLQIPKATGLARVGVISLKLAITGLFVGGILIGLDFLIGKLLGIGDAANDSAGDIRGMRKDLDAMAGARDTIGLAAKKQEAENEVTVAQRLLQTYQKIDKINKQGGYGYGGISAQEKEFLKQYGEKTLVQGIDVQPSVGIAAAERKLAAASEKRGAIQKSLNTAGRLELEQEQKTQSQLQKIDLSAGDGAGKPPKEKSLESYYSLQDQLAKAQTQADIDRIEALFDHRKNLINSVYDLEEARANSVQKEAIAHQRAISNIFLDLQKKQIDARLSMMKTEGSVASGAAPMGASVSGKTGLFQGSTGVSSGPHFDVRRQDGAYISPEQAKALFDPSVRKQLAMTSAYGPRRAPVPGASTFHKGVDLAGPANTPLSLAAGYAMTGSGEKGGLGYAASVRGPQGEMYDVGHLQRPKAGAIAPQPVAGSVKRDVLADQAQVIAAKQATLSITHAEIEAQRQLVIETEKYLAQIFGVAEKEFQSGMLQKKTAMLRAGATDQEIEDAMSLEELNLKYAAGVEAANRQITFNNQLKEKGLISQEELNNRNAYQNLLIEKLNKELPKATQAQLTLNKASKEYAFTGKVKALQDEIKLLLIINSEERRLAELRAGGLSSAEAQKIFDLEKIKKNIEETRALIDGFVSQTSSDYKGFLKAVISGEDAVDALKQFQEGLKDRVLTIFLDFAMAPVEKFLKESLEGLFLPKAPKELKPEEEKAKTGIEGNTVATDKNTTALDNLTAALQGAGATSPTSTVSGGGGGGIFDAANVFGGGGNLTGGIFDTISQQMGGATESLSGFSSHMGKFVDSSVASADAVGSWGDSFNTQLSESLTKATETTNTQGATFQESLGKAVGAIGIAAGAIMGIAAGISQIKKGGTGNTLMGIGSIMASAGSAIGGFTKLFGANGGVAGGGWKPFPVSAFANGGMVKGPTLGLVGEGKYNEAIVPLPDGRSIPVQMRGAGGSGSRDLLANQAQSRPSPSVLSMSFQSTTINGVEYVDRAQLEAAMEETRRAASREGANKGAILAIDRLANSPSSRRRAGIR
jgi:tape measure domain-containing protein